MVEEPHDSLTDAVVDIEAQLLDTEYIFRANLWRIHYSLGNLADLQPQPVETLMVPEFTFALATSEGGSAGSGWDAGRSTDDGSSSGGSTESSEADEIAGTVDTDGVDWNHPPVWDGTAIPHMEVERIHEYIRNHRLPNAQYPTTCKMRVGGGKGKPARTCGATIKGCGNMKSHLWGVEHLNVRRMCTRCGRSHRRDNFGSRHICKA